MTQASTPDPFRPFSVAPGHLLPQVRQWAERAGYQLVWRPDRDFNLASHAAYPGEFKDAMGRLFSDLAQGGHPLRVCIYESNHVVEVTEE
jgi:hypothetical protein